MRFYILNIYFPPKLFLHRSNSFIHKTARINITKIPQICIYVQSQPMHGHKMTGMYTYGTNLTAQQAQDCVRKEIGLKFAKVLECAGVFKMNEEGLNAFHRFLTAVGCEKA